MMAILYVYSNASVRKWNAYLYEVENIGMERKGSDRDATGNFLKLRAEIKLNSKVLNRSSLSATEAKGTGAVPDQLDDPMDEDGRPRAVVERAERRTPPPSRRPSYQNERKRRSKSPLPEGRRPPPPRTSDAMDCLEWKHRLGHPTDVYKQDALSVLISKGYDGNQTPYVKVNRDADFERGPYTACFRDPRALRSGLYDPERASGLTPDHFNDALGNGPGGVRWGGVDPTANKWPEQVLYMNEALVDAIMIKLESPHTYTWNANLARELRGDPPGQPLPPGQIPYRRPVFGYFV